MSRSIWTRCAGSSRVAPLALEAWRVVESQVVVATRKLVDSDAEQEVLERLIDRVKRPVPSDATERRLHFLLYTPFRHAPPPRGSRFGARSERGLWYGSLGLPTAFAEVAYYRLVFLGATAAPLGPVAVELSAFQAAIRTRRSVDLTLRPFSAYEARISSKTTYADSQPLGHDMRAAGIEAFLWRSARDPEQGRNVGLFTPAFARRNPTTPSTWTCTATRQRVEITKKDVFRRMRFAFERATFEVDGALPTPAL